MSPQLFQYRIIYEASGHRFEWVRSGTSRGKVEDLMRRALRLIYGDGARLVSVELILPGESS